MKLSVLALVTFSLLATGSSLFAETKPSPTRIVHWSVVTPDGQVLSFQEVDGGVSLIFDKAGKRLVAVVPRVEDASAGHVSFSLSSGRHILGSKRIRSSSESERIDAMPGSPALSTEHGSFLFMVSKIKEEAGEVPAAAGGCCVSCSWGSACAGISACCSSDGPCCWPYPV